MTAVGVVGASGYSGAELVRLLSNRTDVQISYLTAKQYEGWRVSDLYPNLTGICNETFTGFDPDVALDKAEVIFLALPHGKAIDATAALGRGRVKIIDLSGDLRLKDPALYEEWYGFEHPAPELLKEAVYGLTELKAKEIGGAWLVSNPGCYPTGALLAAAPLLSEGLLEGDVVINSLTGVSGSGRQISDGVHYCACDENAMPYKVGGIHQHIPEMEQVMSEVADRSVRVSFVPILAPFSRGILTSLTARLADSVSVEQLTQLYKGYYVGKRFVRVLDGGQMPGVKAVAGSNYCHIGLALDERLGRINVISAIDNLGKGAAGQAIQNMNVMLGLPEDEGLRIAGVYP